MKQLVIFLCAGALVFSCSDSKHPGYSCTKDGLYYKLYSIGDKDKKPVPGDRVTAQLVFKTEKDSILFDSRNLSMDGSVTFKYEMGTEPGDYRSGFAMLSEGDSASFITTAGLFYKLSGDTLPASLKPETPLLLEIKMLRVLSEKDYAKEQEEHQKKLENGDFEEKKLLDHYIDSLNITTQPVANGLYCISLVEGKGPHAEQGKTVTIQYKGSFLNGRCFDDNCKKEPLSFRLGQSGQVIDGIAAGLSLMRQGGKAKLIIPSHLAFGEQGSSNGTVPPFTAVIYEVELLKVEN